MYLVGIDVGTTHTKAVIFDSDTGHVLSVGSSRTTTRHPRVEWSEFDADALWHTVVQSIRQALVGCDKPERIQAVAVATMGEAGFPLDEAGNVLHPAIAWYDPRTQDQARWWETVLGRASIYQITGQVLRHTFGINKLLWLRDHEPAIFQHIHRWLSVEDFLLWKLSGVVATDYSIASRTMVFDQSTLTWSEALLHHAGIPIEWFSQALPSGTAIGTIHSIAAQETGLPRHTQVATGGHDHLCGALAAGITRPGQLLDSTGTAGVILALGDRFQPRLDLLDHGYSCYAYVERNHYATHGSISFAGGTLEWLITLLYSQGTQQAATSEIYRQALQEAALVPPGARGAVLFPYFLGAGTPNAQRAARGAIMGLTPSHGRAELVRAALEGLAFWLRDNLNALHTLGIAPPHPDIIAVGGPSRFSELMQIKADVTGCRISVPAIIEASATGAALLAGQSIGVFHSGDEAAAAVHHSARIYEPDIKTSREYDIFYQQTHLSMQQAVVE